MIHDVVIVGGGPAGLAIAARLCESTPSALFTDAEHARYWRRHSKIGHTIEKEKRGKRHSRRHGSHGITGSSRSIVVLDATSDTWMSSWNSKFETLRITTLRSPLFFHCDPRDRDGLLAYTHAVRRTNELVEITNVVGREVSKHQKKKDRKKRCSCNTSTRHLELDNRDKIDYYTPSSTLFKDYCKDIIARYQLEEIVHKAEVASIVYDDAGIGTEDGKLFALTTKTGQVYLARTVVLAVGQGMKPSIPKPYDFLHLPPTRSGSLSHIFDQSPCHLRSRLPQYLQDRLRRKEPANILVIGGGLTSAQISHLLLTSDDPAAKVILLLRSRYKIKPFDVSLPWVSKLRNRNMATFWSADTDEERAEMLREAKNGGSITPSYDKILTSLQREGRLQIITEAVVVPGTTWDSRTEEWTIRLQRTVSSSTVTAHVPQEWTLPTPIAHILFATASPPDIYTIPFLSHLRSTNPILSISGLPKLTDSLSWDDETPLFVTGALAGLRLGPGAGNLAGARLGAERVAWGIENVLGGASLKPHGKTTSSEHGSEDSGYVSDRSCGKAANGDEGVQDRSEFTGGFCNQFEVLSTEGRD